ncbi:unnamed protein product [Cuscuta europaea]|uniref:Nonsense-mediated mRNA decay factor SMG8 n=1 Tax=Cuscuta europaea TaxID=41803 RepID=A0A9P0ZC20_CUSEU|nr:unnamed protein product [Cuscuta europaea]
MDSQKLPNCQPMRVLIRSPTPAPAHGSNPPLPTSLPHRLNGVAVVGFIGKRQADVTGLINRIIDSNVFGSGGLDRPFRIDRLEIGEEVQSWFRSRDISYYHDDEKGILYLQFSSTRCPAMEVDTESRMGFDSIFEDYEFGDLQAMLFIFSVCHVVIFIQEGSHFDTQTLKKFRTLQAAKNAMSPYVKSLTMPPSSSGSRFSSPSRIPRSETLCNNYSHLDSRGALSRNTSATTSMPGLGSYASLLPGQCTPVTLFVYLDEFLDNIPGSSVEKPIEVPSLDQSPNMSSSLRPNFPTKGPGSVVVLARPVNESEGGSGKKLQSSLEAQIRFSIKKSRILSGSDNSYRGRNAALSNSVPLFSLDASKAVVLVDISSIQKGEALEYASSIVEDILCGKASSDALLVECHNRSATKEDILSVKEFICRQLGILRGRGSIVSNTSSSSATGIGMVAAAAAAAAASASAASGRIFTTPELPCLDIWFSSSQLILHAILSSQHECIDKKEIIKVKPRRQNSVSPPIKGIASKVSDPLETAVYYLSSGRGLNTRFSTLWCQKALSAAKEVYLNSLPPCYSTSQHVAHLESALSAFRSMVKGPAVHLYTQKLEDQCTSIWSSGRQLCDAVSLTGKPCMHPRHNDETDTQHSSGFVFLHACACGRSRRLRSDPFDFETANVTFNCSMDCDKLLPMLQPPRGSVIGPVQHSSWNLVRVGNARYYQPSKGLIQSGFSATHKFLSKWSVLLEKPKILNASLQKNFPVVSSHPFHSKSKNGFNADAMDDQIDATRLHDNEMQGEARIQRKSSLCDIKGEDMTNYIGKKHSNFTMRKPFSEVVAGSSSSGSAFPPLQSKMHPQQSFVGIKQQSAKDRNREKVNEISAGQESEKVRVTLAIDKAVIGNVALSNGSGKANPFSESGTFSMHINSASEVKTVTSLKHANVYFGFEHECPHGHRFILSSEHLNELGAPYLVTEESPATFDREENHKMAEPPRVGKSGGHGKSLRQLNGIISSPSSRARNLEKSKERTYNGYGYVDGPMHSSKPPKEQTSTIKGSALGKDLDPGLQPHSLSGASSTLSLLDRNLPLYMNCPHCVESKNKNDETDTKFAGSVSQLQRIFVVTPPFPVVLVACPVIQFEVSCLPPSIPDRETKLQFSLSCPVVLAPDSFLSLRLPFVYGVQLEDGTLHPLKPFEHQPQLTAWITSSTTLKFVSNDSNCEEGFQT